MKQNLNQLFLIILLPLISWASGDGIAIGNGGGLAEQSLVYSAQQFERLLQSCKKYSACAALEPQKSLVEGLLSCTLLQTRDLRFSVVSETPELENPFDARGRRYVRLTDGSVVINRSHLYSNQNEPMRIPAATEFWAGINLDHCAIMPASSSAELAKRLGAFVSFDSEQVTIGKDNLSLPIQEWIRVRTLYSDLIIEAPHSILRLSCRDSSLADCSLGDEITGSANARFGSLSLVSEELIDGKLVFHLEGRFSSPQNGVQNFRLRAEYLNGKPVRVEWQGKLLIIPETNPL